MAQSEKTSPQARNVIAKLGGVAAVAEMAERDQSRVRRWTYPKESGGTGGLIPADIQIVLMRVAEEQGKSLTPQDFFPESQESTAK